ncbi:MAG: virion morphogenesis family protein [Bacteriophage sp.]|jgi:HK97 gp10 family phage protein|nr:MAG: virion morphogenesis family protein [Bacteriophage sp.]DAG52341.1 MAG TPA: type I neck protein [Bacteriophage sp.]
MGEFNTVGLEDIIEAFSKREAATVEAVPKMLKAGADVLVEAQKAEAMAMGLNETGGFINSIKATDVKGSDTEKYVEIYPQGRAGHGNDRKGDKSKVRYATIGFVAEYGTSKQQARPYMTTANEKAHEKVVEAQRNIWESETGK